MHWTCSSPRKGPCIWHPLLRGPTTVGRTYVHFWTFDDLLWHPQWWHREPY